MVIIKETAGTSEIAKISLQLGPDMFQSARDLFYEDDALREKVIPVYHGDVGEPEFFLAFQSNLAMDIDSEMARRLPVYVSDFRDYDIEHERLDFQFLERGEVFIFDELEEYSYTIAYLIKKYFPDKYLFFKDRYARKLFEENPLFNVIEKDSDFYTDFAFLISKSIYQVSSAPMSMSADNPLQVLEKKYLSLELMTSVFWQTETFRFGEKNPDKVFCVIKNPLGMEGLSDMLRFSVYRAEAITLCDRNMIPVIDLSVEGDDNQFNGGSGENVWTMFFKQITRTPLSEIYQSRNVIFVRDHLKAINPYVQEQIFFNDDADLFAKWVRFSDTAKEYLDRLYAETIPESGNRVLGVVGRGSDYNMNALAGILNRPSGPAELLGRVEELYKRDNYDYVFLATEDETVYETFMTSRISERVCSVAQPRVTLKAEDNRFLVDVYKEQKRDGYKDNLRYLGIIYILSRCTALIASTNCGAYRLALGFNNHRYEYTEVFDLKKANEVER